uniref:Uncharacterized protein n=1 Tax=Arundo donax TaxID=35708 RepID=A0A0A9G4J5_ARUDO
MLVAAACFASPCSSPFTTPAVTATRSGSGVHAPAAVPAGAESQTNQWYHAPSLSRHQIDLAHGPRVVAGPG